MVRRRPRHRVESILRPARRTVGDPLRAVERRRAGDLVTAVAAAGSRDRHRRLGQVAGGGDGARSASARPIRAASSGCARMATTRSISDRATISRCSTTSCSISASRLGSRPPISPPAQIRQALADRLAGANAYLWVVDDLPSGLSRRSVEGWLAPSDNGRTLITTRSDVQQWAGTHVAFDALDPASAVALLTHARTPADAVEHDEAHRLADDLGTGIRSRSSSRRSPFKTWIRRIPGAARTRRRAMRWTSPPRCSRHSRTSCRIASRRT